MGIENFFSTLSKIKVVQKKYIDEIELEANYLYIDFNSIIHLIVDEFEYEINYYMYSLIIKDSHADDKYYEIEKKYGIKFTELDDFLNYFTQDRVDECIKDNIYIYILKSYVEI